MMADSWQSPERGGSSTVVQIQSIHAYSMCAMIMMFIHSVCVTVTVSGVCRRPLWTE